MLLYLYLFYVSVNGVWKMNVSRIVGNNISLQMKEKGLSRESLARKVGMTSEDVLRIQSGRLYLSGKELNKIAEAIGVNLELLLNRRNGDDYKQLIHCMGKINNHDNVDRILDYIDTYITLKEDSAE